MSTHPLVLRDSDISYILQNLDANALHSIIQTLSISLREFSTSPSKVHQPLRQSISTSNGFTTLFMPSSNTTLTGIKTVTLNTATSASPKGVLTIFDETGELQGVLNAEELTGFRTALVSVVLLLKRIKAGSSVKNIVFFGTGKQAKWALSLCMNLIPDLQQITIVGRSTVEHTREALPAARRLNGVAKWSLSSPDCKFVALAPQNDPDFNLNLEKAIGASDAVFCCTPATVPLFPIQYLKTQNDCYISLIGSYKPHMKEIDPLYLKRENVKVVVDSKVACLAEAGEIIQAGLRAQDLIEIGEILGVDDSILSEEYRGNLVFKCVGLAIMDLVVGAEILRLARGQRAKRSSLGVEVPFFS
ncbi:hypothetical protein Q9L58_008286 [Maublancomyces gigas]|uniref:Thiomorpholine-carboxylate dehydrogenase n=1 Tax=Discina gigas TaxID=1032678 RepID=A0ABR3GA29_9PEZI